MLPGYSPIAGRWLGIFYVEKHIKYLCAYLHTRQKTLIFAMSKGNNNNNFKKRGQRYKFCNSKMLSPKDKFFAEATFNKPLVGIGSAISTSANSLEEVEQSIISECKRMKQSAHIRIRENKSEFPSFNWEFVKTFNFEL